MKHTNHADLLNSIPMEPDLIMSVKILKPIPGMKVALPFDEEGVIKEVESNKPWSNMIRVKITKGKAFHKKNQIEEYKFNQLIAI